MMTGLAREVIRWLPVGLIPIANGMLRMLIYEETLCEPWSWLLSATLDVALILVYAILLNRLDAEYCGEAGKEELTGATGSASDTGKTEE